MIALGLEDRALPPLRERAAGPPPSYADRHHHHHVGVDAMIAAIIALTRRRDRSHTRHADQSGDRRQGSIDQEAGSLTTRPLQDRYGSFPDQRLRAKPGSGRLTVSVGAGINYR